MPQITDIFIDKEEDMLDCQQVIKFDKFKAQTQPKNEEIEYLEQDFDLLNKTRSRIEDS